MAALFSWLPSLPYPEEQDGYWSPVTSTLDWCEEVRMPNMRLERCLYLRRTMSLRHTLQSLSTRSRILLFMYLASKGIRNCLKHGHDTVFLVAFIGYVLVGTGSFLFHATLKCKLEMTSTTLFVSDAHRPYAARGRTFNDIHHVSYVLRNILIW